MYLRLASYNIHKCVGNDRRRRPDRTLAVLSGLGADVVALQEVDHRLGTRPAALPRVLAEQAMGLQALPFALHPLSMGWHGQVIFVRPEYQLAEMRRIALPGLEPRGALMVDLIAGGNAFRIVSVHLGLLRRHRKMQLAAVHAALSHRRQMPTVILGDFNEWSPRGGAAELGEGFVTHSPGPSFPAGRPIVRLDRIALGPGAHLQHAGIYSEGLANSASDHLPIWAEVRLDAQGG